MLRAEFLRRHFSLPGNKLVEIPIKRAAKESKLRLPWRYRLMYPAPSGVPPRPFVRGQQWSGRGFAFTSRGGRQIAPATHHMLTYWAGVGGADGTMNMCSGCPRCT
jgi:hypothetical protein